MLSTVPRDPCETAPSRRGLLSGAARVALLMAAAGVLPGIARASRYEAAAFGATTLPGLLQALGIAAPVESRAVSLAAPEIAENGAVVPVGVSTSLTGVRRLLVLVERNPAVLSAMFEPGEAVDPDFSLRLKMAQSSSVFAVALTAGGEALFARKDVQVILGGCG
ncbi:thiosulfate oxidation carrier protein SoxY [Aquincola sp. MAHUQ-54]|uniref:Thiosulfate oxidation carrier protein SoxY n=1 Tax=Aquincola agrisoli TaxID=3119538 RepID=A0AAW9QHT3_9BURK